MDYKVDLAGESLRRYGRQVMKYGERIGDSVELLF